MIERAPVSTSGSNRVVPERIDPVENVPANSVPIDSAERIHVTESSNYRPSSKFGSESSEPSELGSVGLNWKGWLLLCHLLGTAVVVIWIVAQVFRLSLIRRRAQFLGTGEIAVEYQDLVKRFGIRSAPPLQISNEILSPIAFGLVRPVVMLPTEAVERLPLTVLKPILAHELAHIQRHDLIVNWLQLVLFSIWWFNPVVWLVNRAVRKTREECCDDLLLTRGFVSQDSYCDTLVSAAATLAARVPIGAALGFAEHLHPLRKRVARIMDRTIRRSPKLSFVGGLVVLLSAGLILPGLRSQETKEKVRPSFVEGRVDLSRRGEDSGNPAPSIETFEQLFAKLQWFHHRVTPYLPLVRESEKVVEQLGSESVPFLKEKLLRRVGQTI
ncbi:MAG: M56 family metallopeptidase [Verrucomicrobia bacterium]|nr:M56 family metallopeptidase [Verrucomicrobiota bacterium]